MPPDDPALAALLMQLIGTNNTASQDRTGNRLGDPSYMQNWLEILGIPYEALAGAQGNFDPTAYQPTVEYAEMPEMPSAPMLSAYLGTQGVEGQIAADIQSGLSPSEILADLQAGGVQDPDEIDRYRDIATDLFKEQATYSDAMSRMPSEPQIESVQLSPAAQAYADAGLPLPTDQWQPENFDISEVGVRDIRNTNRGAGSSLERMMARQPPADAPSSGTPFIDPSHPNAGRQPSVLADAGISIGVDGMGRPMIRSTAGSGLSTPTQPGTQGFADSQNAEVARRGGNLVFDTQTNTRANPLEVANEANAPMVEAFRRQQRALELSRAGERAQRERSVDNFNSMRNTQFSKRRSSNMNESGQSPLHQALLRRIAGLGG